MWKRLGLAVLILAALYGVVSAALPVYTRLSAWVESLRGTSDAPAVASNRTADDQAQTANGLRQTANGGQAQNANGPGQTANDLGRATHDQTPGVNDVVQISASGTVGDATATGGGGAAAGGGPGGLDSPSTTGGSSIANSYADSYANSYGQRYAGRPSHWVHVHLMDYRVAARRRGLLGGNPSGYWTITITAGNSTVQLRSPNSDAWMRLQADGDWHPYEQHWWVLLPPGVSQAAVRVTLWERHHIQAEEALATAVAYATFSGGASRVDSATGGRPGGGTSLTSLHLRGQAGADADFICVVSSDAPPAPEAVPKGTLLAQGYDPGSAYKLGINSEPTLSGWGLRVAQVLETGAGAGARTGAGAIGTGAGVGTGAGAGVGAGVGAGQGFSPAQMIGLASGDIITAVDGQPIRSLADLNWVKAQVQDTRNVQIRFIPAQAPDLQVVALTRFQAS